VARPPRGPRRRAPVAEDPRIARPRSPGPAR
jgi:hypothetical protein